MRCAKCDVTIRLDHRRLPTLPSAPDQNRRLVGGAAVLGALLAGVLVLYVVTKPNYPTQLPVPATARGSNDVPGAAPGMQPNVPSIAAPVDVLSIPPPPLKVCNWQPVNGEVLAANQNFGLGSNAVRVSNGTEGNAIVNLRTAASNELVVSFFVAVGQTATVRRIPPGIYRTQFAFGDDLSEDCITFVQTKVVKERTRTMELRVTRNANREEYHNREYTLYAVPGGNAPTHSIPLSSFYAR